MKNKTATECWNMLRGELDSEIDSHVPMKKQGKRSKKKHLSKEAFRKIRYQIKFYFYFVNQIKFYLVTHNTYYVHFITSEVTEEIL